MCETTVFDEDLPGFFAGKMVRRETFKTPSRFTCNFYFTDNFLAGKKRRRGKCKNAFPSYRQFLFHR